MKELKNIGASVRDRLRNYARGRGEVFQRTLTRFAIERLLFRLCQTSARERYTLKGATLFITWPEHVFRPSGDLDLLGGGDSDPEVVRKLFSEICAIEHPEDGISFNGETIDVEVMREDGQYQGLRLRVEATLDSANFPVLIDVGFGDYVFPTAKRQKFPCLLEEMAAPEILMYPPETVIAEKFEAMVRFGEAMSRMKDFYDVWVVTQTFDFDQSALVEAISGTLRRRDTATPGEMPVALSDAYAQTTDRQKGWQGFLRRNPPTLEPPPLPELLADLRRFFEPLIAGLTAPETAAGSWSHDARTWR